MTPAAARSRASTVRHSSASTRKAGRRNSRSRSTASRPVHGAHRCRNGYLRRADNTGTLIFDPALKEKFGIRAQLHDGRLTVYLEPLDGAVRVGDEIKLKLALHDPSMPAPVEDVAVLRIVDEEKDAKKNGKKPEPKAGEKGRREGAGDPAPTHGLPPFRLLTQDGREIAGEETEVWPDGFTEHDGGEIKDLGADGTLYKINYDNAYHLRYRMQGRDDLARDVVTEKYILGMRIILLGCEHALRVLKEAKGGSANGIAEVQDEFRRMAARGAASTVLALAENLPKIVDRTSITASQDVE